MKFTKSNHTNYADALIKEVSGLKALNQQLNDLSNPIKTPYVVSVNTTTLELEHIHQLAGSKSQWGKFGRSLAQFHLHVKNHFGWHENNYIGLNPQINTTTSDWGQFFTRQRLAVQINMIKESKVKSRLNQTLSTIEVPLIAFLNQHVEFSSLLHGDLWSGNVLFDNNDVWLIDPAVYCGDADADLAMTELFGGFPAVFYHAYTAVKPLSNQYAMKKTIYNLYHQLNHYNLFGDGYLAGCEQGFVAIIKYFET